MTADVEVEVGDYSVDRSRKVMAKLKIPDCHFAAGTQRERVAVELGWIEWQKDQQIVAVCSSTVVASRLSAQAWQTVRTAVSWQTKRRGRNSS